METCLAVGARLCSAAEVIADEAAYTGCTVGNILGGTLFDNARIWSSTGSVQTDQYGRETDISTGEPLSMVCEGNESSWVLSAAGASENIWDIPFRCTDPSELHAVRCCADVDPGCTGGTDAVCDYTCDDGYTAVGEHICGGNRTFSGGFCDPNPCTIGNFIPNAVSACEGNTSDICDYACNQGFIVAGDHVCGPDAAWSGGLCQPLQCLRGNVVRKSSFVCMGKTLEECDYTCDPGYFPNGSHVCQPDSSFAGGYCQPEPCTLNTTLTHSTSVCTGATAEVCDYSCDPGYLDAMLVYGTEHVCQSNHAFVGGNCTILTCTSSFVDDSPTLCSGQFGDVCTFRCFTGFQPEGTHMCSPSGEFEGGECVGRECLLGNEIQFSPTDCIGRAGEVCNYTCSPGYTITGEHLCQRSGLFSGGSCVPNPCADDQPVHSTTTCSGGMSDTCEYTCMAGYTVDGTHVCQPNRTFGGGRCAGNPCTAGRTVANSATLCNGTTGEVCGVECDPGYHLVGSHVCGRSGVHFGATCEPNTCSADQLTQSSTVCNGVTGDVCTFDCAFGYTATGAHECTVYGNFSGGVCAANPCTVGNVVRRSDTNCVGATTDVCEYTCAGGTVHSGRTHLCHPDGVWRGGFCFSWVGVVGYTSFEEPAAMQSPGAVGYQDNPPAGAVDWSASGHDLIVRAGQNPVVYTACDRATRATGNPRGLSGGAFYVGCFVDNTPSGRRDLPDIGTLTVLTASTEAAAAAQCDTSCAGYQYFGLQWTSQCYCGNTYGSQGTTASACIECGIASGTSCNNRNAVYSRGLADSELGFSTHYVSAGGTGLTDGDVVGVIGDTSTVAGAAGRGGPAPDGRQYYAMQDTDGFVYGMLDTVDIAGLDFLDLACWTRVDATVWEWSDQLRVWAVDAAGLEIEAFRDADMDDGPHAVWQAVAANLVELSATATVMFGASTSSAAEMVWFDHFVLTGTATDPFLPKPVPSDGAGMVGTGMPQPCAAPADTTYPAGPVILPRAVVGCTNPAAFNYRPYATDDDGSCATTPLEMFSGCGHDPPGVGALPRARHIVLADGSHYLTPTTPPACAETCLQTFGCASFDFSLIAQRCYLMDGNPIAPDPATGDDLLDGDDDWRHYTRCSQYDLMDTDSGSVMVAGSG